MESSIRSLQEASKGLRYISESDYPFEVLHIEEQTSSLQDSLLELSAKATGTKLEVITLEQFFSNMITCHPDATDVQKLTANWFLNLQKVLQEELSDVAVYKIGEIQIDAFIIGKLKDGSYAGLRTKVIET